MAREGGGWYADPAGGGWDYPTEPEQRRVKWPFVLAAVVAVLVIGGATALGLRLAGDGGAGQGVGAAATTPSSWSTARSTSPTSTSSSAPQVRPATGRGSGSSACTKEDLARDSGWGAISYLDCFGDWAVVRPRAGTGDGGVFRLVDGRWTPTSYGPSSCLNRGDGEEIPGALKRKHLLSCEPTSTRRTSQSRPSVSTTRPSSSERPTPPSVPPPAPEPTPEPSPEPTPEPTPTPTELDPSLYEEES